MKLRKLSLGKLAVLTCGLVILLTLVWVGAGLAEPGPLPAWNWNEKNLRRIKVPSGPTLTFAVLGGNRSNPKVFVQVLKQMDKDPGLAFAMDVGDLVETGTVENFRVFLDQVRRYLHLPLLTVIGNHDLERGHGARLYQKIFGPYHYAFQLKDNYFIVVNDVNKTGFGQAQWRWLNIELKKSQSYQTRLVFLHVPLFNPRKGEHHTLPVATGRKLAALFSRYHVTHIFAGHIHGYFTGKWDGVPYTITAGGGAPLYGTDPQHFFYHYLKVSLEGGKVAIQVRRLATKGTP
jgi:serine/threonine-protein phosphatase CPPED1